MSKRQEDSLHIPEERFTCQNCGRCCTKWTIPVDRVKVEALQKHPWAAKAFVRQRDSMGESHRIRMVKGRCFFLDEHNHCRIHAELGYAAKPEGCKAFPLHVTQVAGHTHLRLSFYCPAVLANQGKRLAEQTRWIKETVKSSGDVSRKSPLMLDPDHPLSLTELNDLEAILSIILDKKDFPIGDRLAAGWALLSRVRKNQDGSPLSSKLNAMKKIEMAELIHEGRAAGSASRAGPVFSLFLGQDCAPSTGGRLTHFFGVRLFQLGLMPLSSWIIEAKASRKAIQRIEYDPPSIGHELVTRYLIHKLRSRRIVSDDLTFTAGFNLLIAAYGIIHLLSRLHAAAHGQTCSQEEGVMKGVQAADLLVVEHTTLYRGGLLGTLTESLLQQPELGPSILARLIEGASTR